LKSHEQLSSNPKVSYFIFVIYEDGSTYESVISSQKDVDKIPKDKAYEGIKIVYKDNPVYSHLLYGNDNIFLRFYDDDNCLYYSQFDDDKEFVKVIVLKGPEIEDEFTDKDLPKTFVGKLLPDNEYEKLRRKCNEWMPS
jgi:hypothetical protein